MDFSFSADQQNVRDAIFKICERFPDEYWLERDREGGRRASLGRFALDDRERLRVVPVATPVLRASTR